MTPTLSISLPFIHSESLNEKFPPLFSCSGDVVEVCDRALIELKSNKLSFSSRPNNQKVITKQKSTVRVCVSVSMEVISDIFG